MIQTLSDLIQGKATSIGAVLAPVVAFVLYRFFGKTLDEVWRRLVRRIQPEAKQKADVAQLQSALIAEMRRTDEERRVAERALRAVRRLRKELHGTRREAADD